VTIFYASRAKAYLDGKEIPIFSDLTYKFIEIPPEAIRSSKERLRDLCRTCWHREDEHDHISGNTLRRDCEMPGCDCDNMTYWHDPEAV
jgi:hypothetical protein